MNSTCITCQRVSLPIYYSLFILDILGQWSCPRKFGQCPPPCGSFAFTTLSNGKALLYGGSYRTSAGNTGLNNDIYTVEMTKSAVVSIIE